MRPSAETGMAADRADATVLRTSVLWWLPAVAVLSCVAGEGEVWIGGRVVSAGTSEPVAGAEVLLFDNLMGADLDRPCSELREAHSDTTDAEGRFSVDGPVYGVGCGDCDYGVLCIEHPEHAVRRIRFNTCDDYGGLLANPELVVELEPL